MTHRFSPYQRGSKNDQINISKGQAKPFPGHGSLLCTSINRYLGIVVFGRTGILGLLRIVSHLSLGAYFDDARNELCGSS